MKYSNTETHTAAMLSFVQDLVTRMIWETETRITRIIYIYLYSDNQEERVQMFDFCLTWSWPQSWQWTWLPWRQWLTWSGSQRLCCSKLQAGWRRERAKSRWHRGAPRRASEGWRGPVSVLTCTAPATSGCSLHSRPVTDTKRQREYQDRNLYLRNPLKTTSFSPFQRRPET